jgi:hypothetical protein
MDISSLLALEAPSMEVKNKNPQNAASLYLHQKVSICTPVLLAFLNPVNSLTNLIFLSAKRGRVPNNQSLSQSPKTLFTRKST